MLGSILLPEAGPRAQEPRRADEGADNQGMIRFYW